MKRVNWKQQKLSFVPKLISDAVVEVEPKELISQADDYDTSEQSVLPSSKYVDSSACRRRLGDNICFCPLIWHAAMRK